MKSLIWILLFAGLKTFAASFAAPSAIQIHSQPGVIWALQPVSKTELLFNTREGELFLLNVKNKKAEKIQIQLPLFTEGQGGFLDLSLHPDFKNNHRLYFSYSCKKEDLNTTCLGYGVLDLKKRHVENVKEIFAAKPFIKSSLHFGSRIAWDENKNLFLSMGERFTKKDQAQNLNTHLGKVLHLTDEGKPVANNPFINDPKALPEIYSYGHRNPQGLFYDVRTKTLWESEHGARGGDEINTITPGKNYGWPVITHGVDYDGSPIGEGKEKPGMEQPVYFYVPSIATSSLLMYSGKKYPELKDDILVGALAGMHVNHLVMKDKKVSKEEKWLLDFKERIRDLIETESGDIYFSTDSGKIFELTFSKN